MGLPVQSAFGLGMPQNGPLSLPALLKRRACTYREMLEATDGYTPWRRVDECLKPGEQIVKGKRGKWVTWRVVSATRWTA